MTISRLLLPVLAISVLFLSSCEKVIDIDLNNAEKKYVIEGMITDQAGTAKVLISQTKNFNEDNSFPGVAGAVVSITENGGATTILTPGAPGIYTAPGLAGTSGKTYTLSVQVGGQSFTAVSVMPQKVNFDTAYVTDELLFTETFKIVNIVFNEPPGLGNSYRFVQYVNGVKEDQVFILNDDYTDGRRIVNKLFYFADDDEDDTKIKSGDQVTIDMQCIDQPVYKYWFSLDRSATGGSGQATPSNPVTNLQGGALGYFSAHTLQTRVIVVP